MAATNTQLGEILLAGDLAGDGGPQVGTNPQLTHIPGLVAGTYSQPNITVDSKGRIVNIAEVPSSGLPDLPVATATRTGVVLLGDHIYVSEEAEPAFWTIDFGGFLTEDDATGLVDQDCATYQLHIAIDGGATQVINVAGSDGQTVADVISTLNSRLTGAVAGIIDGNFVISSLEQGGNSRVRISNAALFACMAGFESIGGETAGIGSCEIHVKRASTSEYGVVKIGNGISVEDGVISVDPIDVPVATTTTQGSVIVPESGHLTIDELGNIGVPVATPTTNGVVTIGAGLIVNDGVLSVNLPNATKTTKGIVRVGNNISVSGGVISVPLSDATTIGVAKVGAGLTSESGVVSLNIASNTTLGAVKGGGIGVTLDPDGTINADPLPDATTSSKGVVQIGTGINVSNGVISLAPATQTTLGIVKIGEGLSVLGGEVSVVLADDTTKGVLTSADSSKLLVENGLISLVDGNLISTNEQNTYTGAQVTALYDLGTAVSVTPDLSESNSFAWTTSGGSPVMNEPLNAVAGGTYTFIVNFGLAPPGTRSTIRFPTSFKYPYGGPGPVFQSGIIPRTMLMSCVYDGVNYYCSFVYVGGL